MTKFFFGSQKKLFAGFMGFLIFIMVGMIVVFKLDHDLFISFIEDISLQQMFLASLGIIVVFFLSTLRFAIINRKFGGNENFLFLHRLNMLSMLYSQIAIPIITQIIGRVTHGATERRAYYAPITVFEKSIALAIMILLGGLAFFLLMGKNIFAPPLSSALILVTGGVSCIFLITINIFFTKQERQQLVSSILKITKIGILPVTLLSILIQLGILFVYTVIAYQFLPDVNLLVLLGIFSIVVLATTIPIGFSGWGLREGTAAAVFFSLGMAPEIGILVGLLYGVLNLILLVISVALLRKKTNQASKNKTSLLNPFKGVNFWPLSFLILMIVFPFQIRLPLESGVMTFNIADILALMLMINFILGHYLKAQLKFIWVDPLVWVGLIGISLAIMLSWLVGWIYFDSNEWASTNRLLGFITALSFLFSGAALRNHVSHEMLLKLAYVAAFSFIFSAFYKIFTFNINLFSWVLDLHWNLLRSTYNWKSSVQGFMGDRNAFCFLGAICATLIVYNLRLSDVNNKSIKIAVTLLSIITIILIYTGSRTGLGAAVCIGIYLIIFLNKHIMLTIFVSFLTVSFFESVNIFVTGGYYIKALDGRDLLSTFKVDTVRGDSWASGLKLFFENPLFGGGLGSNMKQTGLVIHSVWLWILAEMGLVGIFLFIPITFAFGKTMWKRFYKIKIPLRQNSQLHGTVLFIIIFGGFSFFQDIAYQRILWLMLGFILATSLIDKKKNET
jgi:hypothetical protein